MTNLEFSKKDTAFRKACLKVPADSIPDHAKEKNSEGKFLGLKPTSRQASKFRRGKGIAFKYLNS